MMRRSVFWNPKELKAVCSISLSSYAKFAMTSIFYQMKNVQKSQRQFNLVEFTKILKIVEFAKKILIFRTTKKFVPEEALIFVLTFKTKILVWDAILATNWMIMINVMLWTFQDVQNTTRTLNATSVILGSTWKTTNAQILLLIFRNVLLMLLRTLVSTVIVVLYWVKMVKSAWKKID